MQAPHLAKRSPYSTRSKKVESDSEEVYVTASPMNNSALIAAPSQAMGDHSRAKHRVRTRKSDRTHLQRFDDYRWLVYLFISVLFVYLLGRVLIQLWPRPEKTFLERLIDHLSLFFTA